MHGAKRMGVLADGRHGRLRRLLRPGPTSPRGDAIDNGQAEAAQSDEQGGVWIDIDPSGFVADVGRLGGDDGALALQIQRSVPVDYQLEKISPILAGATLRALEDRRPFASTNVGRGADGGQYLMHSQLHVGPRGENSTLVIRVVEALKESALVSHARTEEDTGASTASLMRLFDQTTGVADTARQLLPRLLALTGMEAAGIFLIGGDTQANVIAAYGPTRKRGSPYSAISLDEPIVRALLARPRVALFTGKAPLPEPVASLACSAYDCLVLAPAVAGSVVTALIVLSRRRPGPLAMPELDAIETVRHAFGLFVRNRFLDETSRHAEPILQTAYTVSKAISGAVDLDRTFSEIAVNAARSIHGSHCVLLEREEASGGFVPSACSDGSALALMELQERIVIEGEALTRLRSGAGVQLQDPEWGKTLDRPAIRKAGLKSALVVPMVAQSDLIGALLLFSRGDRERYSEEEVTSARAVAEQATIAIHNARLYRNLTSSQGRIQALLARLSDTREQERQRLAQLVHDEILQAIVAAAYRLDAYRRLVEDSDADEFDEIVDLLRRTILDARRVIWEMRPPVLDSLGLAEAMRALAIHGEGGEETAVRVDCEALPAMSPAVSTALYRIAREALLNARRHAKAQHVRLTLKADTTGGSPTVRLRVEDDGVGFDTGVRASPEHYGHAMMEEQATVLGGSVLIESELGHGTHIDVSVPTHE